MRMRKAVEWFFEGETLTGGEHSRIRDCYGLTRLFITARGEDDWDIMVRYKDNINLTGIPVVLKPDDAGNLLAELPIYSRYVEVIVRLPVGASAVVTAGATA